MSKLYVYMFRSRNKDNRDIPGFKERCKTILEYSENEERVIEQFKKFANDGIIGERTRMYRSVNARDEEKVREVLIIRLLKDKPSMNRMNSILASVAQQAENRAESKWLFDFDNEDLDAVIAFSQDIPVFSKWHKTPNGYAVICEHGFDTRELMEKWKDYDITLKRDELLFMDMIERK